MQSPGLVPRQESVVVVDLRALGFVVVGHVAALAAGFAEIDYSDFQCLRFLRKVTLVILTDTFPFSASACSP